ncbi:seryl-tRNA synthetase, partial [Tremellales sp. Uapishka_1]
MASSRLALRRALARPGTLPSNTHTPVVHRGYASHVPTKAPLVFPIKPPSAPPPPAPSVLASSSSSSSGTSLPRTPIAPVSLLPKPRPDYTRLLSNPTQTTRNHLLRASPLSTDHVSHIQRLRATHLLLLEKLNNIKAKQNEVGQLIRNSLGDREENLRQAKKLKTRIGDYEKTFSDTESELLELASALPNFSHPDVPLGPEENAIVLESFGPDPLPSDPERDHTRITAHFDLVDTEASSTASGSSWPYLKRELCLLEQALIQYALSVALRHGYTPVATPDVVKVDIAQRCGFQPRDQSSQVYYIQPSAADTSPTLCLTGTAEIPLSALFADRIFSEKELPLKVVGVGKAFRAEAGARGADTRGLYRVHQFQKVELFAVASETQSEAEMESIRAVQKEIAQSLGLSVRVLDMPTEELGASAARKYDMEAWMPGRGKWGEITSTSNCTDYQSRRLHIRYRSGEAIPFAHTLNGTAAAIPRLLVALLENGVRLQGDEIVGLDVPKVLQRFWIGGEEMSKNGGEIRWV